MTEIILYIYILDYLLVRLASLKRAPRLVPCALCLVFKLQGVNAPWIVRNYGFSYPGLIGSFLISQTL